MMLYLPIALLLVLAFCFGLLLMRLWTGPSNFDRLVVFESLAILLICFAAFMGWVLQTEWFFDAVLVLSLIGFLSTLAIAMHLSREKES